MLQIDNQHSFDTYKDKLVAQKCLAEILYIGGLSLFLGAGVSVNAKLPKWWELVKKCTIDYMPAKSNSIDRNTDSSQLNSLVDELSLKFDNFEDFKSFIKHKLYDNSNINNLISNELLISLGAMVIGSRRGSISDIFTLNFDDILETYFKLHGYVTQVITKLPNLYCEPDVRIFHPHGFLPHFSDLKDAESDFLIFTEFSFDKRLGAQVDPWKEATRNLFTSKLVLLVGVSTKDPILKSLTADISEKIKDDRLLGFWMLGPEDETPDAFFQQRNLIPIRFNNYNEYSPFLLGVCNEASKNF